ncbi:MAG: glycosyltransferase family 9 protein [Bryobacteraceae bacterium]
MPGPRILVVRLSSMGDILHTLPAVASLKHSLPHSHLSWLVDPRWAPLLEGNPFLDEIIPFHRRSVTVIRTAWKRMRAAKIDVAVDFQGLVQSALMAALARPDKLYGFGTSQARERPAVLFYSHTTDARTVHMVEQNLELAAAAGASSTLRAFPIPPGAPEGELPEGRFVLASPLAGWGAKQWPLEFFAALAARLRAEYNLPLVVNGPPQAAALLNRITGAWPHSSGLAGLIDATRKASAVVGVDSGPLHLAAALSKPGVAIYGPTDPARNGPFGGTITVLRVPEAKTTHRRGADPATSMRSIGADAVFDALRAGLTLKSAGCPA